MHTSSSDSVSSQPAPAPTPGSDIGFPAVTMHAVRPNEPVEGVVVSSRPCAAGGSKAAAFVRHIEIDIAGTPLEGSFVAGQSFGVVPDGVDAKGRLHRVRLYSIASPTQGEDGAGRVLATTVKRTIDEDWDTHKLFVGVASNYLCDLQVGDKVRIAGPNGKRFVLPSAPEEHDYIFFGTGTGVAPFRGMVQELLGAGCKSRIALVLGAPYRTDLLYDDLFTKLAAAHENFSYIPAVSREVDPGTGRGVYVQDRLETHAADLMPGLESGRALVYICGVAGMELGVLQGLARGLDPEARAQYVGVNEGSPPVDKWERRMLHKEIRSTRKVFIEVY